MESWNVIENQGIGPVCLGMNWNQVSSISMLREQIENYGIISPHKYPCKTFLGRNIAVTFNKEGVVEWIEIVGSTNMEVQIENHCVFTESFRRLKKYLQLVDKNLYINVDENHVASEKLGIVSWSINNKDVSVIAVCNPSSFPLSFGNLKPYKCKIMAVPSAWIR